MEDETIGLHNLRPAAGATRPRKRVGRGPASGDGKTSGRGNKGQKARSGGGVRTGFEGGQNPIYMRIGKLRGSNKKMSMPMGPFRTTTLPVNVSSLAAFDAGSTVTPADLRSAGLIRSDKHPVKLLGNGDMPHKLDVHVHQASASARAKVEAAGGTVTLIEFKRQSNKSRAAAATAE